VFEADYGAKWPNAVAKITEHIDVLLAFYDYPAQHWIHLRTTNPIESTFAAVRLRQRVTKGPGSRAAGVAMAFKLIESAQTRWRAVNATAMCLADHAAVDGELAAPLAAGIGSSALPLRVVGQRRVVASHSDGVQRAAFGRPARFRLVRLSGLACDAVPFQRHRDGRAPHGQSIALAIKLPAHSQSTGGEYRKSTSRISTMSNGRTLPTTRGR
jgi:hypothetical protein